MTELYHITRSYFVTYTRRTSQLEKDCYLIELRTGNVNIASSKLNQIAILLELRCSASIRNKIRAGYMI